MYAHKCLASCVIYVCIARRSLGGATLSLPVVSCPFEGHAAAKVTEIKVGDTS